MQNPVLSVIGFWTGFLAKFRFFPVIFGFGVFAFGEVITTNHWLRFSGRLTETENRKFRLTDNTGPGLDLFKLSPVFILGLDTTKENVREIGNFFRDKKHVGLRNRKVEWGWNQCLDLSP